MRIKIYIIKKYKYLGFILIYLFGSIIVLENIIYYNNIIYGFVYNNFLK